MNEDNILMLDTITLKDYLNRDFNFKLKDKPIGFIEIKVLSGDEIADVYYIDNEVERFDSNIVGDRETAFFDGSYLITNKNEYNKFLKRTDTYDCELFLG